MPQNDHSMTPDDTSTDPETRRQQLIDNIAFLVVQQHRHNQVYANIQNPSRTGDERGRTDVIAK